jgi:hypothetical protein
MISFDLKLKKSKIIAKYLYSPRLCQYVAWMPLEQYVPKEHRPPIEDHRRCAMRRAMLVAVVAVGVGGLAFSGVAQDVKKLRTHPDAAADQSLQQGNVELPSEAASYPGGASGARTKPKTGIAVSSGQTTTATSKQK